MGVWYLGERREEIWIDDILIDKVKEEKASHRDGYIHFESMRRRNSSLRLEYWKRSVKWERMRMEEMEVWYQLQQLLYIMMRHILSYTT